MLMMLGCWFKSSKQTWQADDIWDQNKQSEEWSNLEKMEKQKFTTIQYGIALKFFYNGALS